MNGEGKPEAKEGIDRMEQEHGPLAQQTLTNVEAGAEIKVRLFGHEDVKDGIYAGVVDHHGGDHLMVWVTTGADDGFAVAVMEADGEGVWFWRERT